MRQLSKIANGLIGQPMFKLLARVKEMERAGKKIIHFEIGDPNFDTPEVVVQAAKDALDNKETHYTDSMGLWDLRQEVCTFTKRKLNYEPLVEQVLIIQANAIIDFAIRCIANPQEEVIIPDPGFPTYSSVLNYAGMKAIGVPLKEENGFRMSPKDIRKSITDKTRLIIINSPNNPTGAMLTQEEIQEVFEIAKEFDLYLLSDEVYSGVTYEKAHYSPSVYDQCKERTITLNSFSKIYSMSGWRLGYAIGPKEVIAKMGLLLETIVSCLPPFIQRGGIAMLTSSQELVKERNEELRKRRDLLIGGLNKIPGFSCSLPDGAFYALVNIKHTGLSGEQVSNLLLDKAQAAVLDGKCFGKYAEGYIRLCYASTSLDLIKQALERIRKTIQEEVSTHKISISI